MMLMLAPHGLHQTVNHQYFLFTNPHRQHLEQTVALHTIENMHLSKEKLSADNLKIWSLLPNVENITVS